MPDRCPNLILRGDPAGVPVVGTGSHNVILAGPQGRHTHSQDFTPHVLEKQKQFIPAKPKLQELKLEYATLSPARLHVTIDEKTKIFSDPKTLQQFLKQQESASGKRRLSTSE
ncbi:hypothetical protein NDU88_000434 [Pleurodeles waltl]|uniref:Uncharacterized protein n=1 Tax=Pleurodeles waltl TaxID=8319 RepID=A0AAV7P0V2_PLEWA|nr:hypothetical protein NDU88_000434 [Pleurodeles waltl]